jgi:uncharacterized protein YndB with AHSA1/START domain
MKILKRILLVIGIIIAIPLILAIFTKKEYTVSREITINRPNQDVFGYIKLLRNQENYNKWVMADPKMKKEFKGTDGTEGFVYAWDGNDEAGKGEQEIKQIKEGEKIATEIRFIEPFAGIANTEMSALALPGNQTNVKWTFHGVMNYPMNAMLLFADMNDILGKQLQESLNNLKNTLEKQ